MLRRLFAALTALAAAAEEFAASFREANERFRQQLALDDADTPALPPVPERRNGRKERV